MKAMKNHCSCCELGKARKRRRGEEEEDQDTTPKDRLSRLPDFIIHHILSFLDTKSAVQTSVLSRVWRCAWKHVPVLDLRSESFKRYSRFQLYVDKVLSLRYPVNLHKLSYLSEKDMSLSFLIPMKKRDYAQFVRAIEYALRHDTQHLSINLNHRLHYDEYYESPNLFSTTLNCNLKTLELDNIATDIRFLSFGFRTLSTLKLGGCSLFFHHEEDLDPFSNLPCLQDLAVIESFNRLPQHLSEMRFKVSGLQLLSLVLESADFCKIEVCAPKLKSFRFREDDDGETFISLVLSAPSLDHADISVYPHISVHGHECVKERLVSLFRGLHNVESLTLHSILLKVLSDLDAFLEQQPSPFTRLKLLKLPSTSIHYKVANYFFKGSSCAKPVIELFMRKISY
ncbi:unnamed protein product [Linum tenue]|uniref:F-box domain-containing protein n=1 Tax=Linum tenue TaxID=586396 RepID=A0AAV0JTU6_9ROSI|nr:unnamed protein product [Linum tenue]